MQTVGGLPALLAGVNSGRYQFAFGPVGDYKDREAANDFVDWVQEYVVFAALKGNPKGITSLDTACGHRIAVMAGGSAERVIKVQAGQVQGRWQGRGRSAVLHRPAELDPGRPLQARRCLLLLAGAAHLFRVSGERPAGTDRRRPEERL